MTDVRHALKQFLRRPAFTATALLVLALGIGAPTAVFSVVHAVLLRPLPYPDADRIVRFRMEGQSPAGPISFDALPASMALLWSKESQALDDLALFNDRALTLSTAAGPFRLTGVSATPNLFSVLGTRPAAGRTFDSAGAQREIVLSDATWRLYFNADRAVVDSLITMDGESYRVVGIMPAAFHFPAVDTAFWVPQQMSADGTRGMVLPAVARLRPHATVAAVRDEGSQRLDDGHSGPFKSSLVVETLQDQMVGGVRRVLWVLLGAVAFVSVIAAANLALLLLTRGAGREREFAIRASLGAGRSRLMRQLLTESLTLGLFGGVAGVALAVSICRALILIAPTAIPRLQDAGLDASVLSFAAALTIGCTLVVGALSSTSVLSQSANRAIPIRRRLSSLAAVEIALTMVLLVGAGLLLRSFVGLVTADQGFDSKGVLALQVNLPASRYPTPSARLAFHERLLESLRRAPGVSMAGLALTLPMRQPTGRFAFSSSPDVLSMHDPFSMPVVDVHMVTGGFMEAMGLRLVEGRTISRSDLDGAEPVIVISSLFASQQFHGRPATGQLLYSSSGNRRVAGVVADVRPAEIGAEPKPDAYIPIEQSPDVLQWFGTVTAIVRGGDTTALASTVRPLILGLDPQSPPFNVRPLADDFATVVSGPRFSATVLSMFAMVALVMACLGVYGVMAYSMRLRMREIGIRLAVGGTRAQVLGLLLRHGGRVIAIGLAGGLLTATLLARTLTSLLHEVTPADPLTVTIVATLLASAGLAATFIPALRVTRQDAVAALREP